jgi:Polysaccharide pyruvyl transferase.
MKHIGVVANHKTVNYGTMLQAYAMQEALEKLGYQAETIDLSGVETDIRRKKLAFFLSQTPVTSFLKEKIPYADKKLRKLLDRDFRDRCAVREKLFSDFRGRHFSMSGQCANRMSLTEAAEKYDMVLVGSDQIWLPSNIAADIFTLSFVPDKIKKVAYASSFGVSSLPKSQWNAAGTFLNRIDYVSVRERSGQRIAEETAGRQVPVVCDPTLLFTAEQWDNMVPKKHIAEGPYILCYFLGNNQDQRSFVSEARKITGLKIVSLLHMDGYIKSDNHFADIAPFDIGPDEFINLIRFADFIFTDSFHGTVFSILNRKSVFTFDRYKRDAAVSTNTRIDNLFELPGLSDRHINAADNPKICVDTPVDYSSALADIALLRKSSWTYLTRALEG